MKTQGAILLLTVAAVSCGCLICPVSWVGAMGTPGSGRVVEETHRVSGFTGVEMATIGNLHIEVGEREELRIEAEDNLIKYFEIDVLDDTLRIRTRPGVALRPTQPVNFYLTVKELDTIRISGSGDVYAPDLAAEHLFISISGSGDLDAGDLSGDEVEARIAGSGDLTVDGIEAQKQTITITGSGDAEIEDLNVDALEVEITGSGHLDIQDGQVKGQRISLTGSGDYGARHLESQEADVRISGSGGVTVQVDEQLDARIFGSGNVHYAGSPRITQSVTGSGDVVRIEN